MKKIVMLLLFIFVFYCRLYAQEEPEKNEDVGKLKREVSQLKSQFGQMNTSYDEKIDELEAKIKRLEAEKAGREASLSALMQSPEAESGRYFQSFNPDISVIGDFLGHATSNEADENADRFYIRELELAFSDYVDPYARADIFIHIHEHDGEWHAGLCEGYLTLLSLPWDIQAKLGKFKSAFGKVNRMHTHNLPWVDRPNMGVNFFGGSMSEEGLSLNRLIPNAGDRYIELTLEAFNNENAAGFAGNNADDLVYLAHLKNFFDITDEKTLELGISFATGPNDAGHGGNRTNLQGVDLTYKWRPLKEGLYKSLVFQNEALFSQKDQVDLKQVDSWGAYSSLVYQFAKRLSVFSRYDLAEFPDYSNRRDEAVSAGMTFAQSEYCFWRLHFKRTDRDYDKDSNEMWLQCNFGLGPHRAHAY